MRHTTIAIHSSHLSHNLEIIKKHAPHARVMAMVKSNAYGHGVAYVLPALVGADAFGVATLSEGLEVFGLLKARQTPKPVVLIEGVFDMGEWKVAVNHDFGAVVHSVAQLNWALEIVPEMGSFARTIWLKYNTGMNRLGFDRAGVLHSAKQLIQKGYDIVLTSHFACADDESNPANTVQITRFNEMLGQLKQLYGNKVQGSLCNSAGIVNFPHVHHDWVRAGIALYGGTPVMGRSADMLGLKPAMTFMTQIFAVHELSVGEQVGYGGLWTADRHTRLGVLSVGYGDGYPRVVNGAKVLIIKDNHKYFAPIVGRVAMDMMMIDMTDLPIGLGDTVVLWGDDLSADDVATWANTISYELFCKTTNRPIRMNKNKNDLY